MGEMMNWRKIIRRMKRDGARFDRALMKMFGAD
jgi:hypothetical protein